MTRSTFSEGIRWARRIVQGAACVPGFLAVSARIAEAMRPATSRVVLRDGLLLRYPDGSELEIKKTPGGEAASLWVDGFPAGRVALTGGLF